MRKGEIACYKQFLLFSQCFPKLYIFRVSNAAWCGNGLKTWQPCMATMSHWLAGCPHPPPY